MAKKPPPGSEWRIIARGDYSAPDLNIHSKDYPSGEHAEALKLTESSIIDEVVIRPWLHVEQMSTSRWFVLIANKAIYIRVENGKARITSEEDRP